MLPVSWATIRVFLHVVAATVWVGGQLTLAGLVPGLRSFGADAPRAVARRFNRIAWPAYGMLVATGNTRARSRSALAAFGALSGLTALGALFLGVQLG